MITDAYNSLRSGSVDDVTGSRSCQRVPSGLIFLGFLRTEAQTRTQHFSVHYTKQISTSFAYKRYR